MLLRSCDHIMISVAAICKSSRVWDPRLVPYSLEHPEMIRSHEDIYISCIYNFSVRPLYCIELHNPKVKKQKSMIVLLFIDYILKYLWFTAS